MLSRENILGLFTGKPKTLGPRKLLTAIDKTSVAGSVAVLKTGLQGDVVVDLKHHGGPDRAIHHYSQIHYQHLQEKFPEHAHLFVPGSYGENILTENITEKDLCVGDIFKLGSALIQVTEPRDPCGVIDLNYGIKGVLKEVFNSGRFGWFYRVLEVGKVQTGDYLEFVDRTSPQFALDKIISEVFLKRGKNKDLFFLNEVYQNADLSDRFKKHILKHLK